MVVGGPTIIFKMNGCYSRSFSIFHWGNADELVSNHAIASFNPGSKTFSK